MKPGQTKVMIPQTHKIITEITIGYLTMPFPVLLPSCSLSLFVAFTISTVEASWVHPQDMKKVSVSGAGHLQELFSVWELAQLQRNIKNAKNLLGSVFGNTVVLTIL